MSATVTLQMMRAQVTLEVKIRQTAQLARRGQTGKCAITCERTGSKGTWHINSLSSDELGFWGHNLYTALTAIFTTKEKTRIEKEVQRVLAKAFANVPLKMEVE